jgi:hypothetical protein
MKINNEFSNDTYRTITRMHTHSLINAWHLLNRGDIPKKFDKSMSITDSMNQISIELGERVILGKINGSERSNQ